jgi:hypothetical protein
MVGKSTSGSADLGPAWHDFRLSLWLIKLYEENVEEESLEGCNMSMLQKKPRRFAGNPASV